MEEVWKDINLASFDDVPNNSENSYFRDMTLRDFLAKPFNNGGSERDAQFLGSSSVLIHKRDSEKDDSSSDRRRKRMIKNRESAERSRARKQAYITELEHEVAHLQKENARLKRQQEELCARAVACVRIAKEANSV